jgi:pyridinium-3,5-bisthiocarboxylic acid mononucleotide nickel chelatase
MTWWIDAGAGASGDMLLDAMLALAPDALPAVQADVDTVLHRLNASGQVTIGHEPARRGGFAATRAVVECRDTTTERTWAHIEPALAGFDAAAEVFRALAAAEAAVHGVATRDIHFHEVGALDAIADIVAVTSLWQRLAPGRIGVSAVCVGSGTVETAHGTLTVPGPAVVELLRGVPTFAGSVAHEACTPTGAALLRFLATEWGPQPAITVTEVGVGAGGRDTPGQANVVRILVGRDAPDTATEHLVMVETTIDDLDPRLYPDVLEAAKAAGALEGWLTPVIMKHGRPAVVLSALAPPTAVSAVTTCLFRQTTTLGVRLTEVARESLRRDYVEVQVQGRPVRVKRGWLDGEPVTAQPEYRDARAVAESTDTPIREVLRDAADRARDQD